MHYTNVKKSAILSAAIININVIGGRYLIKCKVTLASVTSITEALMVIAIVFGPNNPHVVGIIFTSHWKCFFEVANFFTAQTQGMSYIRD